MEKDKDIVQYRNEINRITFKNFSSTDYNFFMGICAKIREIGKSKVYISFSEIRKICGYTYVSKKKFYEDLDNLNSKMSEITIRLVTEKSIYYRSLFSIVMPRDDSQMIIVDVLPEVLPYLCRITSNYTIFELKAFVHLKSKFSKALFRVLKQYKDTGVYYIGLMGLKQLMDLPDDYLNKRIKAKIIDPAVKELTAQNVFENLKCQVAYDVHKHGKPISGFTFTFTPQKKSRNAAAADVIQLGTTADAGAGKNAAAKNARKNKFLNFDPVDGIDYDAIAAKKAMDQLGKKSQ